jgi:hypothetical protein
MGLLLVASAGNFRDETGASSVRTEDFGDCGSNS